MGEGHTQYQTKPNQTRPLPRGSHRRRRTRADILHIWAFSERRSKTAEGSRPLRLPDAMLDADGVTLDFRDCSVTLATEPCKTILREVSGQATAGNLFAIMGPSGAGKTTLLNLLAGLPSSSTELRSGTVTLNGNLFTGERPPSASAPLALPDAEPACRLRGPQRVVMG